MSSMKPLCLDILQNSAGDFVFLPFYLKSNKLPMVSVRNGESGGTILSCLLSAHGTYEA